MDAAWSELSTAEIQELVGGGRNGEEGGKTLFEFGTECSPLHWAAAYGNLISLTYLLVSSRVAKSEDSFKIRHLGKFFAILFFKKVACDWNYFFCPQFFSKQTSKQ